MAVNYKRELGNKIKTAASRPDSSRIHVISRKNSWIIQKEGASRAQRVYPSKEVAVQKALTSVKNGDAKTVIIHKKDGSIESLEK